LERCLISGQLLPAGAYKENSYAGTEVAIEENGKWQITLTDSEGKFKFSSLKAGNYKVKLTFSYFANVIWYYSGQKRFDQPGIPTIFEYEVKLKQGECDYKFFEVIKPTPK